MLLPARPCTCKAHGISSLLQLRFNQPMMVSNVHHYGREKGPDHATGASLMSLSIDECNHTCLELTIMQPLGTAHVPVLAGPKQALKQVTS